MKKSYIIPLVILSLLMIISVSKIQTNLSKIDAVKTNAYLDEKNLGFSKIEKFYDSELTDNYASILNLKKDYKLKDALDDNLFVISNTIYNSNLYDTFKDKVKRGKDAFLRVAIITIEGDILIYDIKVENKKVEVIFDNTRDRFLDDDNRKIELKEFTSDDMDFGSNPKDFINSLMQFYEVQQ